MLLGGKSRGHSFEDTSTIDLCEVPRELAPPNEGGALVPGGSVMTGSVCVPQIDEYVRKRFARVDIDDPDIHEEK